MEYLPFLLGWTLIRPDAPISADRLIHTITPTRGNNDPLDQAISSGAGITLQYCRNLLAALVGNFVFEPN